jgi:hypothetical protein
MQTVLFFRDPPASRSFLADVTSVIFENTPASFFFGRCDQTHFLYSVSKAILIFEFRKQIIFNWQKKSPYHESFSQ